MSKATDTIERLLSDAETDRTEIARLSQKAEEDKAEIERLTKRVAGLDSHSTALEKMVNAYAAKYGPLA